MRKGVELAEQLVTQLAEDAEREHRAAGDFGSEISEDEGRSAGCFFASAQGWEERMVQVMPVAVVASIVSGLPIAALAARSIAVRRCGSLAVNVLRRRMVSSGSSFFQTRMPG